jgi:hypothetical protein
MKGTLGEAKPYNAVLFLLPRAHQTDPRKNTKDSSADARKVCSTLRNAITENP